MPHVSVMTAGVPPQLSGTLQRRSFANSISWRHFMHDTVRQPPGVVRSTAFRPGCAIVACLNLRGTDRRPDTSPSPRLALKPHACIFAGLPVSDASSTLLISIDQAGEFRTNAFFE